MNVETNIGGQPQVDGCRVTIDAYVGTMKKDTFGVDLVTGSLMTTASQTVTDPVLDLRGLEAPTMRLYPVVDHIADKLCATQAMYGADGNLPSSRVRDLVDLVVLARSQDVDGSALISAVRGEWTHRSLPGTPVFAPPADWERRYSPEARKAPVVADMTGSLMRSRSSGRSWPPCSTAAPQGGAGSRATSPGGDRRPHCLHRAI